MSHKIKGDGDLNAEEMDDMFHETFGEKEKKEAKLSDEDDN